MATHQGKQLAVLVKSDKRTVAEVAQKMGYAREHLYMMFKLKTFNKIQIANIANVYDIKKITDQSQDILSIDHTLTIQKIQKTVEQLEDTIEEIRDDNRELNKKFNQLLLDYRMLQDMATKLQNNFERINKKWGANVLAK